MKDHGGGSHNNHAHPDHKMSRAQQVYPKWHRKFRKWFRPQTSTQLGVSKKVAAKKRRQRDRVSQEDWS